MTTFNWTITQLDRKTSDGFVTTVHYNVTATDDTYTANTYGTVNYTQEPDGSYVPYASLTEATVIGWVQGSLGKDVVEASLQSQIDAQKNPIQLSGTPWNN